MMHSVDKFFIYQIEKLKTTYSSKMFIHEHFKGSQQVVSTLKSHRLKIQSQLVNGSISSLVLQLAELSLQRESFAGLC